MEGGQIKKASRLNHHGLGSKFRFVYHSRQADKRAWDSKELKVHIRVLDL
jgi:hypothetical protein